MTTPWSLYCGALSMQCVLLARVQGNHLRWLGAVDACIAELAERSVLARMQAARLGAFALHAAVARGQYADVTRAREAFVGELAAVVADVPRPIEALREARGAFLRTLANDDAAEVDDALWGLATTAARAVLASKIDKPHQTAPRPRLTRGRA